MERFSNLEIFISANGYSVQTTPMNGRPQSIDDMYVFKTFKELSAWLKSNLKRPRASLEAETVKSGHGGFPDITLGIK